MLIGLLKKIAEKICYLIFAQKYLILKTIVKLEIIRNCLIKKKLVYFKSKSLIAILLLEMEMEFILANNIIYILFKVAFI